MSYGQFSENSNGLILCISHHFEIDTMGRIIVLELQFFSSCLLRHLKLILIICSPPEEVYKVCYGYFSGEPQMTIDYLGYLQSVPATHFTTDRYKSTDRYAFSRIEDGFLGLCANSQPLPDRL